MKKIFDGNKACLTIAYKYTDIAGIYPITPSSPMASEYEKKVKRGEKNLFGNIPSISQLQSEAGASGFVHGSLLSGSLSTSFTSSQGLLLMIPTMFKVAGEELPLVLHVASRTVATHALSIFGDHQDIYQTRDTGFCMIASGSVQEAYDLAAVAHLSSIASSMPFLHFFDGFRTSHEINVIDTIDDKYLKQLINKKSLKEFKERSMNIFNPMTHGTNQNEDVYFQMVEARNKDYDEVLKIINNYFDEINNIQKTNYKAFNYYGDKHAKNIIVAMGSVSKTIIKVINELNKKGAKLGFVQVHLYRPFSSKLLNEAIPETVEKIAVLDRAKMPGSSGEPLYLDVATSIENKDIKVYSGIYGLSSKNISPSDIVSIYSALEKDIPKHFTVGIHDDVTKRSLKPVKFKLKEDTEEIVIYGYASDGMISASKDLLEVYHDKTKNYVQGYFEYDSKKSGGVTVSNLRFSSEKIEMPYYCEHPKIVVVTKDSYLNKFRVTKNISKNGVIIINSEKKFNDIPISSEVAKDLVEKGITIFTIDANKISSKYGIPGKNGNIFSSILLKMLGVKDYIEELSNFIENRYASLGATVINANIKCVRDATSYLEEYSSHIKVPNKNDIPKTMINAIGSRCGYNLPVSKMLPYRTGEFKGGLSYLEKAHTDGLKPNWNSENCIECGICSLMCPSAAIKPFIVEKDSKYAGLGIDLIGDKLNKYKYLIDISVNDCTSCGVCQSVCPGKGGVRALTMEKNNENKTDLFETHKNPDLFSKFTPMGASLIDPGFKYSDACAGCGQTPYLKLLTSLFKEKIMIVNATGCSSIYGGSIPFTPYSIPWVNPLFENNAEVALGMYEGFRHERKKIIKDLEQKGNELNDVTKEVINNYKNNIDDYEITKNSIESLIQENVSEKIKKLKNFLIAPSIWAVGGDGWAYDIGFSGIDHVLASGKNINILVLDTESYSNTGGQASKSSQVGQVCEFASTGKESTKKDLFRFAMGYKNVYVAQIAIGANITHTLKVLKEADNHPGPSLIICYAPCIEHKIKGGMKNMASEQKLAVESGYFILMRYKDNKLYLDYKNPDFSKYEKIFENEARYSSLKIKNKNEYKILLDKNLADAKERFDFYKNLTID